MAPSKPYATALKHMCADNDLDVSDFEVPFVAHYTGSWMDYFVVPDPHYVAMQAAVDKFPGVGLDDDGSSSGS